MTSNLPLIVGAGPVGLSAALFLARHGIRTRIIDKLLEPSRTSKALGVNPRTLDLLESSGVTRRMLDLGRPIEGATFRSGEKILAEVELSELDHKYPFMLALSQATTERLLTEALAQFDIIPQRQVELAESPELKQGRANLKHLAEDRIESTEAPWILAADGGQSAVRSGLGLDFPGTSFQRDWHLVDIPLETDLPANRVHGTFLEEGVLAQIPVFTGEEKPGQPQLWRLVSNVDNPLTLLPQGKPIGPPDWTSSFSISHRMVERMQVGRVYLAGDAAHLHSPVGARGMNLGIEDAWVFAQLVQRGEMKRYHPLRYEVGQNVVRRIERVTRIVRGRTILTRMIRRLGPSTALRIKTIRQAVLRTITGLDQDLPFGEA